MKKFIVFICCCLASSYAGAWGLLDNLVSFDGDRYVYKKSFLYHVLTRPSDKIRVCVSTEGTSTDPRRQKITRDYFLTSTQQALDAWLAKTRSALGVAARQNPVPDKKSKKKQKNTPPAVSSVPDRTGEFADLLAWLPRRIELQLVNPNGEDCDKEKKGSYDLRIRSLGNMEYGSAISTYSHKRGHAGAIKGVYQGAKNVWELALPGNDGYTRQQIELEEARRQGRSFGSGYVTDYSMKTVTQHEVGHLLGLADLYTSSNPAAQNIDGFYSLLRVEPRSAVVGGAKAVMNKADGISCDDIEGFINAVDFVQAMDGKTSKRLQSGWKSLCAKPYIYLQGAPAKDEQDLEALRAQLKEWKNSAGIAAQINETAREWNEYLEKVRTARDETFDKLYRRRALGQELDKEGLILSAEYNYLSQKAEKIEAVINEKIAPAQKAARTRRTLFPQDVSSLAAQLAPYKEKYGPDTAVLDPRGIFTAVPLADDFPDKLYPCLVCGKPVGRDGYVQTARSGSREYPFHIHFACEDQQKANLGKLTHYKHKPSRRKVPTWGELTSAPNPELAQLSGMAARMNQELALPDLSGLTPRAGSGPAVRLNTATLAGGRTTAGAGVKKKPVRSASEARPAANTSAAAVPPKPDKSAVPARPSAPAVTEPAEQAAPKAVCEVCGKEMAAGTYYTDSVGRTVHKHSECAYRYFKRFHKTDDKNLSRYEDYYFFSVPQDVVQAKADMRKLDLTVADIRRYASQEADKARRLQEELAQQKQAEQVRAQDAEKCRFYVHVTLKDIQVFSEDNQKTLQSVRKKESVGRPLSKKEALVKRNYDQLNENYKLSEYCKARNL